MSAATERSTDIAIVGGGLVGASLALALAPTRCRVALIEPCPPVMRTSRALTSEPPH